jgi:hypothetical protein
MDSVDTFPDDLIDDDATANDLQVTRGTLASWRSRGRGPAWWKIGRRIFYSRTYNRNWKAAQRRDPVPREQRMA